MSRIRVAAAQYFLRPVQHWDGFADQVSAIVETAGGYRARLLVLPEYFTIQLLALDHSDRPIRERIRSVARFRDDYVALLSDLARQHDLYIVGGTMPTLDASEGDGAPGDLPLYNDSYLFAPSGEHATQGKLHMTRWEREEWKVSERQQLKIFETDFGRIAIAICYDVEFPELIRAVAHQDVRLLCVPSCTDDEQGFWRVRHCAHARCIENQLYVIHTGTVGGLPRVPDAALNWGQASILTPCDFAFSRDGILAEGTVNVEGMIIGEVDLDAIAHSREEGTVLPLKDSHRSKALAERLEVVAL